MKLLLVGAGGQVGREIAIHDGMLRHHTLISLTHAALNISNLDEVLNAYLLHQPDLVINAAAYTKVDLAEQDTKIAYAVNAQGAANLAEACEKFNIPLIHFSTDYVFNGEKDTPYHEQDIATPTSVYGDSKWQGEVLVRQRCTKHIILRVSWVFGAYGNNFVKTILRLAMQKTEIKIVSDQRGCPTPAANIANSVFSIIQQITANNSFWGTYHFCGAPAVSWYEFAQTIIHVAVGFQALKVQTVLPISTQEYPTPAIRPTNSVLACEKITTILGIQPPQWADILPNLIKEHFYETLHT